MAASALAQESRLAATKQAATAAPSDAAAQIAYGRALIKAGRLREAETQMGVVVRLSKGSVEALYEVARVKFASGDYKSSRAYCRELAARDANHVLSHVCMARAFLVWRRSSLAFEHVDRALVIDPDNYEARLALADARRIQGDAAGAEAAYQRALAVRANGSEAQHGIGLLHLAFGKYDEARTAFRKAVELDRDDPDTQLELGRLEAGNKGLALVESALTNRPGWPEARLAVGIARLGTGAAASAEEALRAFLKQRPDHAVGTAQLGIALLALGKHDEALGVLQHALELQPNDYDTTIAIAELYERTGRNEEAIAQYRKAADIKQGGAGALIAAARLGVKLARYLLAIALLDKALERAPRSGAALTLYGDALAGRGDKQAARAYYERALNGEGAFDRERVQAALR